MNRELAVTVSRWLGPSAIRNGQPTPSSSKWLREEARAFAAKHNQILLSMGDIEAVDPPGAVWRRQPQPGATLWRIPVLAGSTDPPVGPDEEATVEQLLQLQAHELSRWQVGDIDARGRFPTRHPEGERRLLKASSYVVGVAVVIDGHPRQLAEFFILRRHRRTGLGTLLAHALLDEKPGPWSVSAFRANTGAVAFWTRALLRFGPQRSDTEHYATWFFNTAEEGARHDPQP